MAAARFTADAERVCELRKMVPVDANENTRLTNASKVLRETEEKKLVAVTSEFNHKGGLRLNLLLAGKGISKKKRKLLVELPTRASCWWSCRPCHGPVKPRIRDG
jgi:hypothetical protein